MIGQTFPDVVVLADNQVRLVTHAARSWTYQNTTLGDRVDNFDDMPRNAFLHATVLQLMVDDGLVVMWIRRPVTLSNRRKDRNPTKRETASNDPEDEYDRHRARFEGLTVEKYRKQQQMFRAYGRHKARNWRLMQEAAEKKKAEDEQQN